MVGGEKESGIRSPSPAGVAAVLMGRKGDGVCVRNMGHAAAKRAHRVVSSLHITSCRRVADFDGTSKRVTVWGRDRQCCLGAVRMVR